MKKLLQVMALAAVLGAASVPAFAQSGPTDPSQPGVAPAPLPPCAPGQQPSPQQPCGPTVPPCAPGQQPSPQQPCAILPAGQVPGQQFGPGGQPQGGPGDFANLPKCSTIKTPQPCQPDGPGGPQGAKHGPGGPQGGPMGSFLTRVWRISADADGYDANKNRLGITVTKILNVPKAFRKLDDEIVDEDAIVVFSDTTKVYDDNGKRVPREVKYDKLLDDAESVSVKGTIVDPSKWQKNDDGNPVTTIRAKSVKVTD